MNEMQFSNSYYNFQEDIDGINDVDDQMMMVMMNVYFG